MGSLTIGQLADQTGVSVETVRFYERRGLIEDPPRRPSGYRQYPLATVERISFIRRAKELGFSLDEIGELLRLRSRPAGNREEVWAKTRAKIVDIDRKLADLSRMRTSLQELADACARGDVTEDCPILAALDGRSQERNT